MINEDLARRNKENYSFSEYEQGSATAEYNQRVAEIAEQIEKAKARVSDEGKTKLDNLLNWFKSAYMNWINKHNANGTGHVSWMVSGPANYNMKKHEQWMNKEGKLWNEYDDINNIEAKISSIINSDKIIRTDDKNALEKLRDKLKAAQEEHQQYKDYNIKAKKEGTDRYPSYVLTNSNARIRQIKKRIEQLEKLEQQKEVAKVEGNKEIDINGIKIVDNLEANRVQIIFGFKPDKEIRDKLKRFSFRWSPKNEVWQHYRGYNALEIAKEIVNNIEVK
ncbi:MAG: hypothetical protein LIR50_19250 [Bacillota bacterium]|nr:hypothetical protein [Bacillota bacterium]